MTIKDDDRRQGDRRQSLSPAANATIATIIKDCNRIPWMSNLPVITIAKLAATAVHHNKLAVHSVYTMSATDDPAQRLYSELDALRLLIEGER